jgi:DNA-directed RNA polymerase subunit RPC12/RpoP
LIEALLQGGDKKMKIGGAFLTINERLYLYHYSLLREVIEIFSGRCVNSHPPQWYSIGKLKELNLSENILEKVINTYKPSLLFYIACRNSLSEELDIFLELAKKHQVDLGVGFTLPMLELNPLSIEGINYLSIDLLLPLSSSKTENYLELLFTSNLWKEVHIGVHNKGELSDAIGIMKEIPNGTPIHLFILSEFDYRKLISAEVSKRIYIHDISLGDFELDYVKCQNCGKPLVRGNMPKRGKDNEYSAICQNCGTRVLYRDPNKKWVNVNLLMKGIEVNIPVGFEVYE